MDQICVEIPEGETISEGDIVTLVGGSGEHALLRADIAGLIGATPHEITTCITQRVPRFPSASWIWPRVRPPNKIGHVRLSPMSQPGARLRKSPP